MWGAIIGSVAGGVASSLLEPEPATTENVGRGNPQAIDTVPLSQKLQLVPTANTGSTIAQLAGSSVPRRR